MIDLAGARAQVGEGARDRLARPAPQVKPPPAIEPTMSRPSTVSVTTTLSASETPLFWTVRVKVWLPPPAVTVVAGEVLGDRQVDVLDDRDGVAAGRGRDLVGITGRGVADRRVAVVGGVDGVGHRDRRRGAGAQMGEVAGDRLAVAVRVRAAEVTRGERGHDEAAIDVVGKDDVVGVGDAGVLDRDRERLGRAASRDRVAVEGLGHR